jgi:tripartite-type tricarboxylate transporter receptor subunit TctC
MAFPNFTDFALPAALLAAGWPLSVAAQAYPEKPVRVVVPFPAGGAADIVARHVTTRLSKVIGQQIVVDNRGGAGGAIGADNVARAPADGYSLLFASSSVLSINPHLGAKTAYNVLSSFAPIVRIGDAPNVMTVHPSVPVSSVKAFIALAKAKPGDFAYASNGTGTLSHLTGELFSQRTGVKMLHVPYKGGAPAVIDTVAGNVAVLFAAYPTVASQVRAGRLKALAVTSARRIAIAPQLPTVAESVKGFESSQWWGLYAPAGVSPAVVQKLNAAANQVLSDNEIGKVLAADGAVPAGGTAAALAAFHKADYDKWGEVMAKVGIRKKGR